MTLTSEEQRIVEPPILMSDNTPFVHHLALRKPRTRKIEHKDNRNDT